MSNAGFFYGFTVSWGDHGRRVEYTEGVYPATTECRQDVENTTFLMKPYAPPKLRQIVTEAVFRRSRIVMATVVTVLALVLAATLLMHKKYQADAKLMVQNVRSQSPLSTNASERIVQPNDVSVTEVNSEVDLLQSQTVVRRALEGPAASHAPASEAEQQKVIKVQHALTVENVHQTSLINVKLLANSPEEAEAQLQNILDAYFEERAGAGRSSGAAEFFERQVAEKGKELDVNRQALTDFEVQHNVADLDEQKKLQVTRIAAIEDRLADSSAQLAREESRTFAAKRQLALMPSRSTTTQKTVTNQYSQERLDTALTDLLNRRSELLRRYQPSDRQILELNEKIITTQRAIAEAKQHPASEVATDVNPAWQQLMTAVAASSGEVSGLAAQRAELARQKKEADARLHELQEATGAYDGLKRKVQQGQADYTAYVQKRDEAQISQALDKEKMFDVALVQRPTASLEAVRPKPVLYMLAGLAFSLLLGMALALYTDTSAEQVYSPSQLDALTGARTVATFADEDEGDGYGAANVLEARRLLSAMRNLLSQVPRAAGAGAGLCVAFVSALGREGVSFAVDHVATEAARQPGSRVAVLDMRAMLRRFEAEGHVSFGLQQDAARLFWKLSSEGSEDGGEVRRMQQAAGTQGQFSARLVPLLLEARREFDLILLDCPSLQESTVATELDVCADGYVAVVSAEMARKQNIDQMVAVLKETHAPLLGYTLNRRRYPVPRWLHRTMW